jgi:hypothetical protein
LISFEKNSELTRIESSAFFDCSSLRSITIPRNLQFVDMSAFSKTSMISISITLDYLPFVVESYFLLNSLNMRLIRCFGNESRIIIPRHVQILCSSCFS